MNSRRLPHRAPLPASHPGVLSAPVGGPTRPPATADTMPSVRIVIAPDKFAGTLTAVQAAEAIATGWAGAPRRTNSCNCRWPTAGPVSSMRCRRGSAGAGLGDRVRPVRRAGARGDPAGGGDGLRRVGPGVWAAPAAGGGRDPGRATCTGVGELRGRGRRQGCQAGRHRARRQRYQRRWGGPAGRAGCDQPPGRCADRRADALAHSSRWTSRRRGRRSRGSSCSRRPTSTTRCWGCAERPTSSARRKASPTRTSRGSTPRWSIWRRSAAPARRRLRVPGPPVGSAGRCWRWVPTGARHRYCRRRPRAPG